MIDPSIILFILSRIMDIEKKHPELLDLAFEMDGLSLSDSAGATGVSNSARNIPIKFTK